MKNNIEIEWGNEEKENNRENKIIRIFEKFHEKSRIKKQKRLTR